MKKLLIYLSFVIASLVVIVMFVTARSYTQLAIAILLYLPLIYFGFKAFRSKTLTVRFKKPLIVIQPPVNSSKTAEVEAVEPEEAVAIADIDKRAFLKLIGGVGLSVFLFSLIGKKIGGLLPGGNPVAPETTALLQDTAGNPINPVEKSPTDGYRITDIDDSSTNITFFGFTNQDSAWYIMREDTDSGTFRYAKGDSSFPSNWANRDHLGYNYYDNVFKK